MREMIIPPQRLTLVILICTALVLIPLGLKTFRRTGVLSRAVRQNDVSRIEAMLNAHPELLNAKYGKDKFTSLHWAVIRDRTHIVELLLARGADVNAGDRSGMTPLHKAAVFNRKGIAEMLMVKGADIRATALKYGAIRVTPLHLAAEAGYPDIVESLLAHGADLNAKTGGANQLTPLHMAAGKGRAEVVELLLKKGADVNPRDVNGTTPLHWATVAGAGEVADMLRIYGGTE